MVNIHFIFTNNKYNYSGVWSLDVSTILMLATCKFSSFGFSISDGFKDTEELNLINESILNFELFYNNNKIQSCRHSLFK